MLLAASTKHLFTSAPGSFRLNHITAPQKVFFDELRQVGKQLQDWGVNFLVISRRKRTQEKKISVEKLQMDNVTASQKWSHGVLITPDGWQQYGS